MNLFINGFNVATETISRMVPFSCGNHLWIAPYSRGNHFVNGPYSWGNHIQLRKPFYEWFHTVAGTILWIASCIKETSHEWFHAVQEIILCKVSRKIKETIHECFHTDEETILWIFLFNKGNQSCEWFQAKRRQKLVWGYYMYWRFNTLHSRNHFLNSSMQCSAWNLSTSGFRHLRKGIYVDFRST